MNLSNITFPYPVLGSFDDILPKPESPEVNLTSDKKNYYVDVKLNYDNDEIKQLVEYDFADYVCELVCVSTRYRRCYSGKDLNFHIEIPRKSVGGKILFSFTITVKKNIFNYTNKGFHPDYDGHTFNMEPGDLLGIFDQFYYFADIKYDKLKSVGTFMTIQETDEELPFTRLDRDKVELLLPTSLYEQFKSSPAVNSRPDILHASLVLNSLTYALCRFEQYNDRKWAETIQYRINTEAELSEFRDQDPDEWQIDKLCQILLGHPYERLFNHLIQSNDSNQG